eukprot:4438641-Pleurochrysis_carterae.AAC.2
MKSSRCAKCHRVTAQSNYCANTTICMCTPSYTSQQPIGRCLDLVVPKGKAICNQNHEPVPT